jgi:SAM-dependent methyltransferase
LSSFAESYDRYRPHPPDALLDLLTLLAGVDRPALLVDLGSGTGLSARAWSGRADRVEYVAATSEETGLPDGCADIVTCSQSLHWMEPDPTFAEVGRILRPGGIFAAYDYDSVPVINPEIDAAYEAVMTAAVALREQTGRISPWTTRSAGWKSGHLERMRESGQFSFAREFVLHSVEEGDAERLIGGVRSMGAVEVHKDEELGLEALERVARRVLGDRVVPFWFGYRVRMGVR